MKQPLLTAKSAIQKLPKPSFENFKIFNERFSIVHEFVIRVAVIFGLITLLFFFLKEMTSNKYVLTTIDIAKSIENKQEIYSSDLRQKINLEMKDMISNSKKDATTQQSIKGAVSNENTPINFGGFDLNQVFLYFRSFFNLQSREMRVYVMRDETKKNTEQNSKNYKVLLSIGDEVQPEQEVVSGEEGVSLFLSKKILEYNAPYNLGLYHIRKGVNNKNEIERIMSLLNNLKDNEHWWERIFQKNNWKEKVICLEAIRFSRENIKDYDFVEDFYPINPDKDKTILMLNKIDSLNKKNNALNKILITKSDSIKKKIKNQTDSCLVVDSKFKIDSIRSYLKYAYKPLPISYDRKYDWK